MFSISSIAQLISVQSIDIPGQVIHEGSHIHKPTAEIRIEVRELVGEGVASEQMLNILTGAW